ncbi:hypothetical protein F4809DRAFT_626670 [Biscogniauxia mediterranea]|nr:hypothetical protein F4809DRAFT_626670 [Biscogniauxia mediterranea]
MCVGMRGVWDGDGQDDPVVLFLVLRDIKVMRTLSLGSLKEYLSTHGILEPVYQAFGVQGLSHAVDLLIIKPGEGEI